MAGSLGVDGGAGGAGGRMVGGGTAARGVSAGGAGGGLAGGSPGGAAGGTAAGVAPPGCGTGSMLQPAAKRAAERTRHRKDTGMAGRPSRASGQHCGSAAASGREDEPETCHDIATAGNARPPHMGRMTRSSFPVALKIWRDRDGKAMPGKSRVCVALISDGLCRRPASRRGGSARPAAGPAVPHRSPTRPRRFLLSFRTAVMSHLRGRCTFVGAKAGSAACIRPHRFGVRVD